MSGKASFGIVALAVFIQASSAAAQQPVVETLYVPVFEVDYDIMGPTGGYVDVPLSEQTVELPVGKAVITWSVNAQQATFPRIRPVIGTQSPTEGVRYTGPSTGGTSLSGSWATDIPGGSTAIKLQVDVPGGNFRLFSNSSLTWTVTAYPATAGGLPAVSSWGIGILGLLLLIVATFMILRTKGAKPLGG